LKKIVLFAVLCSVILLLMPMVSSVETSLSDTIIVPDDYPTIQEAIDNADNGDTVFVRIGTYFENISIDKSIVLKGEDKKNTIIDLRNENYLINITAENVNISNFKIYSSDLSILIRNSNNNIIFNNEFMSSYLCIRIDSSNNNIISNNIFFNNYLGIYLRRSDYNTISNNKINGIIDLDRYINSGMYLWYSNNNIIKNNELKNSQEYGIHLYESEKNLVIENNFFDNKWDAAFVYCTNIWYKNYWNNIRFLPMPIKGFMLIIKLSVIRVQFDWFPAKLPNDI